MDHNKTRKLLIVKRISQPLPQHKVVRGILFSCWLNAYSALFVVLYSRPLKFLIFSSKRLFCSVLSSFLMLCLGLLYESKQQPGQPILINWEEVNDSEFELLGEGNFSHVYKT